MKAKWSAIALLTLAWLLAPRAALAQALDALLAKVSRCVPVAEHDPATDAFGASVATRKLRVHFSYAVPVGKDITEAVANTERVEICSYRFAEGPSCPWSEQGDAAWMIYDEPSSPPGALPDAGRVEIGSQITGRERHEVPADWQSETASKERFLFLRVNGEGPMTPIAANVIMGRDGFCPVPYPLAPTPGTIDARFRAYGVEPTISGPFTYDGCDAGSKDVNAYRACIEPDAAAFVLSLLEKTDEWQVERVRSGQPFGQQTWQHGSSSTCGPCSAGPDCPCPMHVFFTPSLPWVGGESVKGGILLPPVGDWARLGPANARLAVTGWPVGVLGHEYYHAFNYAWAREQGLAEPGSPQNHIAQGAPYRESATAKVGWTTCLDGYNDLLPGPNYLHPDLCVSPTRLMRVEPGATNGYLEDPSRDLLNDETVALGEVFWRYAAEQFAVPINELNPQPARPSGGEACRESPLSTCTDNPGTPLGSEIRRPDEGIGLLDRVLKEYQSAPTVPTLDATNDALVEQLNRNLESMLLDLHTAIVLKEFQDLSDVDVNPRWHLEWIGNPNVGASAIDFQDHPPPLLASPPVDDIEQAKNGNSGRLPMEDTAAMPSEYDYLLRPHRELDSYDYALDAFKVLEPGESRGTTQPFRIGPHGAAILSAKVDPGYGTLRVRVFSSPGAALPRVRVFTINTSGHPSLDSRCEGPPYAPYPAPRDYCPFVGVVDAGGTIRMTVDLPIHVTQPDVDEVIAIVSAGGDGAKITYTLGTAQPYIQILDPTTSRPAQVGHRDPSVGRRPFLLQFLVADENNQPIHIPLADVQISVPGCMASSCELSTEDYTLYYFDPGVYWAVVTLPERVYPLYLPNIPATWQGFFDLRVEAPGYGFALEPQALEFDIDPVPPVGLELVVDASGSMQLHDGSRLETAQQLATLAIDALSDRDALAVVRYQHDARTIAELRSLCEGEDVRTDAIATLSGLSPYGCASIGDGLFEAQALLAADFDQPSDYWDLHYPDCKPSQHTLILLSGSPNDSMYRPEDYYLGHDDIGPLDGKPDCTCCIDFDGEDNVLPAEGRLRYLPRRNLGLVVPELQAIAIGKAEQAGGGGIFTVGADVDALQQLLDHTSGGQVLQLTGSSEDSFAERVRMMIEGADAFRQAMDHATGHQRAGAWYAENLTPEQMPSFEVEPFTRELLVSVASARDDTSGLRLVDPDGYEHEPTAARAASSVFRVAEPHVGTWSWTYEGNPCPGVPGPCPTDIDAVFVEQAVRGIVMLFADVGVTTFWPVPSEPGPYEDGNLTGSEVYIRALPTDGGAILSAAAFAEVTTPSGGTSWIALHDDGMHGDAKPDDGVYGALFSDTLSAGTYRLRVIVEGKSTATGADFRREQLVALDLHHGLDADGDGLPDWWEQKYSEDGSLPGPDADDDGLDNYEEFVLGTSPVDADTDGGGESDGSEHARGADPLDPNDDQAHVFRPTLQPGNGKVLLDVAIPLMVDAQIEVQISESPAGPWEPAYVGLAPADNVLAVAAVNEQPSCFRMRSSVGGLTSGWSPPRCTTPDIDPVAPLVRLSQPPVKVTRGDESFVVQIQATDDRRAALEGTSGGALLGMGGVNPGLLDPDIVPSGVSEMKVSLDGDFDSVPWEPYASEVVLPLGDDHFVVVLVRVRDGAGNESRTARLFVRVTAKWPREALVASDNASLGPDSVVLGDVTVIEESDEPGRGPAELRAGHDASVVGSARASLVWLGPSASVSGDVVTDELSGVGSVGGTLHTPLLNPVYAALPDVPSVSPGEFDVTISHRQSHTLEPGSYGTVALESGTAAQPTRLLLSGGLYELEQLLMARHARLECADACEVRMAGKLWTGQATYVGPELGSAEPADLELFVLRHDGSAPGSGGSPKAASLGPSSSVRAHVYAPNGTLWIKQGAEAVGALVGQRVQLGGGAQLRRSD